MEEGRARHVRSTIWMQAGLVWSLKKFDYRTWVERGEMTGIGEPVVLPAEQEQAVNEYMKRIEKAGQFVMPGEVV